MNSKKSMIIAVHKLVILNIEHVRMCLIHYWTAICGSAHETKV